MVVVNFEVSVKFIYKKSVVLSLSKDQLPEGVHLIGRVYDLPGADPSTSSG
jgi:hypothetical protein